MTKFHGKRTLDSMTQKFTHVFTPAFDWVDSTQVHLDTQVSYMLAIVQALRGRVIMFNPYGAGGKGRFEGATVLMRQIEASGQPMPNEFKGLISKGCKVVQAVGGHLVHPVLKDADVLPAIYEFVRTKGGISKVYGELWPS